MKNKIRISKTNMAMKELSIEEKAKAYDKALNRAKSWARGEHPECFTEAQKAAEFIFPELSEPKDERIRKEIIEFLLLPHPQFVGKRIHKEWIDWLEKQGGQKPANKVKPKFNVGDWVVNKGHSYLIAYIDYEERRYLFEIGGYTHEQLNWEYIENVDNKYHLWTIDDAKDGDVLYAKGSYFKEYIFNFSSLIEDNVISTHFGYDAFHGTFDTKFSRFGREEDFVSITPATKEQRDTLMKAVADAGYRFDFKTKELKGIKQSNIEEVNGEDYGINGLWHAQRILEETLGKVVGYQSDDGILEHKCAITTIKKLYKQKPAWSEEDEKIYNLVYEHYENLAHYSHSRDKAEDIPGEILGWLKALKDRYTWKPSDEQMSALDSMLQYGQVSHNSFGHLHLNSLFNDLTKLREG